MFLKRILPLAFGFLVTSAMAEPDYYTWVDENGVTNYAEKKPTEFDARFVTKSYRFGQKKRDTFPEQDEEPVEDSSSQEENSDVDPDALIAEERAKFQAQLAEEKSFNCDVGKKNLTRLETFGRIKIKGDDGNERFLSPEEMDAKKSESRALIRANCSS